MNPIFAAALEIQTFCDDQGWRSSVIGGIAVQRWGEPRLTQDADLTLLTGFGGEDRFVDRLLTRFTGRRADTREFALQYRVMLLEAANGVPVDVSRSWPSRSRRRRRPGCARSWSAGEPGGKRSSVAAQA